MRAALWLTLLSTLLSTLPGCASDPVTPLVLAPLGNHDVPVGATLLLSVVDEGASGAEATLIAAPAGAALLRPHESDHAEPGAIAVLAWQPSAFDLAPTPVGVARAPGKWHQVMVRVCDDAGRFATTTGQVRAVPAASGP